MVEDLIDSFSLLQPVQVNPLLDLCQLFQYSVTMKGQGVSVSYKNMASCIGASCDTDAALKVQEDMLSLFTAIGFEVTVEESGASTFSSAVAAMMALIGVVGTLI